MNRASCPDGVLRAARRRLAVVMVEGLDTTGVRIAEQLISFGIGTVLLRDEQPVTAADADYRRADRGRPRAEAACQMLRPAGASSAVLEAPEGSAVLGLDLHLVVTADAALSRLRSAEQNDSAVLPVELSREGFCIGPLLRQSGSLGSDSLDSDAVGSGALCVDCLILHGLRGSESGESPHVAGSPEQPEPVELPPAAPLGAVAAGLAAHQAQLLIDGESAATTSGALFGEASTGRLGHWAVGPHPECRCLTNCSSLGTSARRRRRGDITRDRDRQSLEPTG